eukprot:7371639-Prymnesium_polylepis.1
MASSGCRAVSVPVRLPSALRPRAPARSPGALRALSRRRQRAHRRHQRARRGERTRPPPIGPPGCG